MNQIISLLFVAISLSAQILPPITNSATASSFSVLNYNTSWYFSEINDGVFDFPLKGSTYFPAFVVRTNSATQNVSALATIVAKFSVEASSDASFVYGGQDVWNIGTTPPHARLFFSSRLGYDGEDGCPKCSWFSVDGWQVISNGCFTISASLDSSRWTDSGARITGTPQIETFEQALASVEEVGVCFGGGCFYDIGVGLKTGFATFKMISLQIIKPVTVTIESSGDLTNWNQLQSFTMTPTNAQNFLRLKVAQ